MTDQSLDILGDRVMAIRSLTEELSLRIARTQDLVARSRALLAMRRAERSWRYRVLLLAVGSTLPDGSDLTPSDRDLLIRFDQAMGRVARAKGEATADEMLKTMVQTLARHEDGACLLLH